MDKIVIDIDGDVCMRNDGIQSFDIHQEKKSDQLK